MFDKLYNAKVFVEEVGYSKYYRQRFGGKSPGNLDKLEQFMRCSTDILFLCHGNICRSPFAKKYASRKFTEQIEISSAGFYCEEGRSSPQNAIQAAKEFQIDLTNHRSCMVKQSDIVQSDVVFLMDFRNVYYLLSKYNTDLNKVYLLGEYNNQVESNLISDPHGCTVDTFKRVYLEITQAIDEIATQL